MSETIRKGMVWGNKKCHLSTFLKSYLNIIVLIYLTGRKTQTEAGARILEWVARTQLLAVSPPAFLSTYVLARSWNQEWAWSWTQHFDPGMHVSQDTLTAVPNAQPRTLVFSWNKTFGVRRHGEWHHTLWFGCSVSQEIQAEHSLFEILAS